MVDGVKYRPSQATRVESLASGMSTEDQKLTIKIMKRDVAPIQITSMNIPVEEKAKVVVKLLQTPPVSLFQPGVAEGRIP